MLIKGPDLAKRSGATERMVDHWTRTGVISCEQREHEGTGYTRYYDEDLIPMLKVFVRISRAFSSRNGVESNVLKKVRDNFMDGYTNIGNDIYVSWNHHG